MPARKRQRRERTHDWQEIQQQTLWPEQEICQLIVDLNTEYPGFSLREISTICFVRFGRKLSHHTVQRVLADGPKPRVTTRRYPPYAQITNPYQRRRAIVDLHAEG